MTIFTVQFDYKGHNMYERLLMAFKNSVQHMMPDTKFIECNLSCPGTKVKKQHSLLSNTIKLREWVEWMKHTDDNTVFMDCDMMLLKTIEPAFDEDFDIAYTVRTSAKMPMNGGVVFAKPTDGARRFFQAWLDANERMYKDRVFHTPYRIKYAGMNQAAFGYLLENPVEGVRLMKLPCAIWNACSEDWRFVDGFTRVVHVKSVLRKTVMSTMSANFSLLKQIWLTYENRDDPTELISKLPMKDNGLEKLLQERKDFEINNNRKAYDGDLHTVGDVQFRIHLHNTEKIVKHLRSQRGLPDKEAREAEKRKTNRPTSYKTIRAKRKRGK